MSINNDYYPWHTDKIIRFGKIIKRQEFGNSWPMAFSEQFAEMIKAFRTTGACFRAVLGSCSEQEGIECKNNYLSTADLK